MNPSSSLSQMSVTLLGPPIEHRDSLTAMFAGRVSRLSWVPDSQTFQKGKGAGLPVRMRRLLDQLRGTSDPDYQNHVINALNESESGLVIAYWGTIPLPDLAAVKKARPGVKLVLMVLCYPLALETMGIHRQNFFMRRAAGLIDGMLYPSQEMAGYFRQRMFRRRVPPGAIIPPCWPAKLSIGQLRSRLSLRRT